jgi:hypothetical protein
MLWKISRKASLDAKGMELVNSITQVIENNFEKPDKNQADN